MSIICPITQTTIKNPIEITSCGHCFEKYALFEHIVRNGFICPYCRSRFTNDRLYESRTLAELCAPKDAATQTEDIEDVPMLIEADDSVEREYFRIVDLGEHHFNPQTRSVRAQQSGIIRHYNRQFPEQVGLNRYVYQSINSDEVEVGEMLARTGYLVYDIFSLGMRGNLHQYVIYSTDKLRQGGYNRLSKYRRLPRTHH